MILTSMLKRVDEAVYATIAEAKAGAFQPGVKRFGLADGGIGYAYDQHNAAVLTEAMRQRADALKAEIIAAKLAVPDYYKRK